MSVQEEPSDIEALRITLAEYRVVLDHQIALLNDLDDEAMWTSRTAVFLLGILVSGVGIAGRLVLASLPPGAMASFGIGGLGLVVTIFAGVGVYPVSQPRFGVTDSHHREVTEMPYPEREWLGLMLDEYDKWRGELEVLNAENARQVFLTQTLLVGSLATLFVATISLTLGLWLTIMTKTKSGRELGVTKGQKGPAYARRFFAWFGITEGGSEPDSSDE